MVSEGDPSPDPRLVELSEVLVGTWRVDGPGIRGEAEYQLAQDGLLIVGDVDVAVGDTRMKNIQHIGHDSDSDTLRARYMDTGGQEATYTWALRDRTIRVSEGDASSDTYFEATVAEDRSSYSGTWHYPDATGDEPPETITYTRRS